MASPMATRRLEWNFGVVWPGDCRALSRVCAVVLAWRIISRVLVNQVIRQVLAESPIRNSLNFTCQNGVSMSKYVGHCLLRIWYSCNTVDFVLGDILFEYRVWGNVTLTDCLVVYTIISRRMPGQNFEIDHGRFLIAVLCHSINVTYTKAASLNCLGVYHV